MLLPELPEGLYYLAAFVATVIAGVIGYTKKPKPTNMDPVIAGVGFEYGVREQQERLIKANSEMVKAVYECAKELKRIADAINDQRTDAITDRLDQQSDSMEKLAKTVEAILTDRRRKGQ